MKQRIHVAVSHGLRQRAGAAFMLRPDETHVRPSGDSAANRKRRMSEHAQDFVEP